MTTSPAAATAAPPRPDSLLRFALRLDAVVSGLNGAAYLAAAPLLDDVLGLSGGLLRGAGVFLLVYGAAVWLVGTRRPIPATAVEAVVAGNSLWVVGSLAVVATGTLTPTTAGAVWLVLQAAVVAGFVALQVAGLRRR
ncbi:hypothetical protein [Blastococcus tunisiensis]|uniref:Integral membrane protein n=1 Tax=Blastococcus tunisiensis TaxID=1798228 RepID=A0A1I2FCV1_9ACTN|nr:hypothetical protein [Blastococcus sp. DSM 46838]SFF02380.1 hypothetical protein SAMN05216574_10848 [Blastococcus sp. DSM 46838]